jgi:hypothetical protein
MDNRLYYGKIDNHPCNSSRRYSYVEIYTFTPIDEYSNETIASIDRYLEALEKDAVYYGVCGIYPNIIDHPRVEGFFDTLDEAITYAQNITMNNSEPIDLTKEFVK